MSLRRYRRERLHRAALREMLRGARSSLRELAGMALGFVAASGFAGGALRLEALAYASTNVRSLAAAPAPSHRRHATPTRSPSATVKKRRTVPASSTSSTKAGASGAPGASSPATAAAYASPASTIAHPAGGKGAAGLAA